MEFFSPNSDGTIFDSSLSDFIDVKLTPNEYKNSVIDLFSIINKRQFQNNIHKQKIYSYVDRISGACPYCHDSAKDSFKKRGNIILKGKHAGNYKCFNCGIFKPVTEFFKDFKINPNLDLINYLASIYSEQDYHSYKNYDISVLINQDIIDKYSLTREELKNKFGFIEVKESPFILNWLKNRFQFEYDRFLYSSKDNYLVILNLTKNKKVLGYQIRNFNKGQEKYKTFNLSKIYEMMRLNIEVPDEVNVISQLYKIFEIDFSKPLILLEGPLDCFLFPNAIANAGANKKFPFDIPIWYFYDDDKTGMSKAIEKLNEGQHVFLWSKFKYDLNLPNRNKWDLNDVIIYLNQNNIRMPYFINYFSNDKMDTIDI